MFTVGQLLAHLVGDYFLQSDWMANEKTKHWYAALLHALFYTLPFLFVTLSPFALILIMATHYVIDRYRLIRYLAWIKNFLSPKVVPREIIIIKPNGSPMPPKITYTRYYPWLQCDKTGYYSGRPDWLTVWLMIIADNTLHLLCNGFIIYVFTKWITIL